MKPVQIYTTNYCSYCVRAKQYFSKKGIPYEEIDVTEDDAVRADLVERSGGQRTVPQIFIGGVHVGGYTDLVKLDGEGGLQPLLGG